MADILTEYKGRGPDGDFTINLPGWAKESTQKKVDQKLAGISKKLNVSGELGKMLKAALDKNTEEITKLRSQQKKDNVGDDKSQKETKQHQSKTQKTEKALANATQGMDEGIAELIKLQKTSSGDGSAGGFSLGDLASKAGPFAVFGNTLFRASKAVGGFAMKIVQGAAAIALAVGNVLLKTFNLMNDSLSNGTAGIVGAFTSGSTNIATEASLAGLSIKAFTEAIQETSEEIVVLGAEGYRDLRNATRDVAGGLYDMGFANEEMTKLLGREISIRARLGMRLNASGTNLANNVVDVAKNLRRIGAVAGISAEELYQRSKLEDETNSLIAARARELGDSGISDLQTSIRKLSMTMVGMSPTYASAIVNPLVNAVITGAVGLDDGFTELVTVFPGLVNSMELAQNDIANSGKITDETITNIMESLVDTTEDEFNRARQLALMTRSQTAIQAVNFASEVRARESVINALTTQGDKARNISVISQQASVFFDMMKAPFENAILQFTMGILGVSTTGADLNFGNLISRFSLMVQDFVENLPIIGNLFIKGGFFNKFNEMVDKYFAAPAGSSGRADARKQLTDLVTNTIDEISATIGDSIQDGSLSGMIAKFFRDLIDDIRISIYETTGVGDEGAALAYLRREQYNKVIEMQDDGILGGIFNSGSLVGVGNDIIGGQMGKAADQFGISTNDFEKMSEMDGLGYKSVVRDNFLKDMMKDYKLTESQVMTVFAGAQEYAKEVQDLFRAAGYADDQFPRNIEALQDQFMDRDERAMKFYSIFSNQQSEIEDRLSTFSNTSLNGIDISGSSRTLNSTMDKINRDVDGAGGVNAVAAATIFRDVLSAGILTGEIVTKDGLDDREKQFIVDTVMSSMEKYLDRNKVSDQEREETVGQLINAMDRLTKRIAEGPGDGAAT